MGVRKPGFCKCGAPTFRGVLCDWHYFDHTLYQICYQAGKKDIPVGNRKRLLRMIIHEIMPAQNHECPYCGDSFWDKSTRPSIDKIIPQVGYKAGNIQILCLSCNARKSGFSIQVPFYQNIVRHQIAVEQQMRLLASIKKFETA